MPDQPESPQSNIVPETRRDPAFALGYLESMLDRIHVLSERAEEPELLMKLGRVLAICTAALFNAHRIADALSQREEADAILHALSALDPHEEL